jgi:hypothetical protein
MSEKNKLLSLLTKDQCWDEFIYSKYPKWGSMCLLRYLGHRVLNAAFIDPLSSTEEIKSIVLNFIGNTGSKKILIRTDGGKEKGSYIRGGNSIEVEKASEQILKILSLNRAVILMEPTNRFTNKLAINMQADNLGIFRIDILGPGFDVSDLNRGLVNPENSAVLTNVNWTEYSPPSAMFTEFFSTPIDQLRHIRLLRIGEELLPALGIQTTGLPDTYAKNWLLENGFTELFDDRRPSINFCQVKKFFESSFILAAVYRRKVQCSSQCFRPWRWKRISFLGYC